MTELKPCPFCGGEAKASKSEDFSGGEYITEIECNICHMHLENLHDDDKTIDLWNTRQSAFDWKPIEELTTEPMPILLYMKSSSGRNVYLPAEILEVNDKGKSLIATEGGVSKLDNIKHIY